MTTLSLNDSEILRQQAYIAGRWCEADNRKSFVVTNPATGEVLAQVPAMEAAETRRAIEAAKGAWLKWRWKTAKERAALLRKWYDLMMANVDDLARIMTAEQGKPLAESKDEITSFFLRSKKTEYTSSQSSTTGGLRIIGGTGYRKNG